MKAFFRPRAAGASLLNKRRGDLIVVGTAPGELPLPDGWPAALTFDGENLAAIRAAHSIAHFTAQSRVISSAAFIERIPAVTWAKVQAVATPQTNPELSKALFRLCAGAEVHSDNPQLLGMLAQLVAGGVLTGAEREFILNF